MNRFTRLATPALALAAAIGAPLTVQAAPEFYGRVNVSLDHLSDYPDGSLSGQLNDVQAARSPLEEGWFLESNSSRLGVRGREPLEVGELSVLYQLEVGYDVDGDSDTFSTRNSFVGLGSVIGDVFAGRYDSPVKMAEGRVDQFNNTAADIGGYFFGQRRNSNTLNWESPDFSGLVVRAQLAPGEGDTSGDEEKTGSPTPSACPPPGPVRRCSRRLPTSGATRKWTTRHRRRRWWTPTATCCAAPWA